MAEHVRTRSGAVLLHRLGPLRAGEQSRWDRAPERHGLWAFPWPLFEMFFAFHQYADAAPVRLRVDGAGPVHRCAYVDAAGDPPPPHVPLDVVREAVRNRAGYRVRDGFYAEREEWIRTVGRRTIRKRTFWHGGVLYTHLTPRGQVLDMDEWRLMPATMFAEAVRRSRPGRQVWRHDGQLQRVRTSADHLEVFLPHRSHAR